MNNFTDLRLTKKQIFSLTVHGKKHWKDCKKHILTLCKSFGIKIESDSDLEYLIEVHCKNETKRLERKFYEDSQTGKILTNLTPTDVKGNFEKVDSPQIGNKYHISWAFSGAVFVLVSIEGDICYLDNPKHKRDKLISCRKSELRNIRNFR